MASRVREFTLNVAIAPAGIGLRWLSTPATWCSALGFGGPRRASMLAMLDMIGHAERSGRPSSTTIRLTSTSRTSVVFCVCRCRAINSSCGDPAHRSQHVAFRALSQPGAHCAFRKCVVLGCPHTTCPSPTAPCVGVDMLTALIGCTWERNPNSEALGRATLVLVRPPDICRMVALAREVDGARYQDSHRRSDARGAAADPGAGQRRCGR